MSAISGTGWRIDRVLLSGFFLVVAMCVALLLWRATFQVSNNYNEGWNAYHVRGLLAGAPLYWPPGAWQTNNYPPLSFLLVAAVARLGADPLMAERTLASLAFLLCTWQVGAIVWRIEADRFAALAAAAVFAGTMAVNFDSYVGIADPHFIAQAWMLGGLLVLLRAPDRPAIQIASAALMVIGLFTKHNILALPASVALWLFFADPRGAARFVATGLAGAALGFALCGAAFGGVFFSSLITPRPLVPLQGIQRSILWLSPLKPFALAGALAATLPGNRAGRLLALNLAIAAPLGVLQLFGRGVGQNSLFEVVVAGSLCTGLAVARLARLWPDRAILTRAALVAAIGIGTMLAPEMTNLARLLPAPIRQDVATTRSVLAALAPLPGPLLCEKLVLCYWAGRALEVEPFNFGQKLLTGQADQAPLIARIARGEFAALVLEGTPEAHGASLYFPPVWDAALTRYRPLPGAFGTTTILVPR